MHVKASGHPTAPVETAGVSTLLGSTSKDLRGDPVSQGFRVPVCVPEFIFVILEGGSPLKPRCHKVAQAAAGETGEAAAHNTGMES